MQDKTPRNKQGHAHGYWERYYLSGHLAYKVNFVDGKQYGYLEVYNTDGILANKQYNAR